MIQFTNLLFSIKNILDVRRTYSAIQSCSWPPDMAVLLSLGRSFLFSYRPFFAMYVCNRNTSIVDTRGQCSKNANLIAMTLSQHTKSVYRKFNGNVLFFSNVVFRSCDELWQNVHAICCYSLIVSLFLMSNCRYLMCLHTFNYRKNFNE